MRVVAMPSPLNVPGGNFIQRRRRCYAATPRLILIALMFLHAFVVVSIYIDDNADIEMADAACAMLSL